MARPGRHSKPYQQGRDWCRMAEYASRWLREAELRRSQRAWDRVAYWTGQLANMAEHNEDFATWFRWEAQHRLAKVMSAQAMMEGRHSVGDPREGTTL